jgi:hypothetical protein
VAETCSTRVKTDVLKVALKTVILSVKVFYLFSSALFISLNFLFICVLIFLMFPFVSLIRISEDLLYCDIPACDSIQCGRWIPPFRRNILPPFSGRTTRCCNPEYRNTNSFLVNLAMFVLKYLCFVTKNGSIIYELERKWLCPI